MKLFSSWKVGYPPTSEIVSYVIKWRSDKTVFNDINFSESDSVCGDNGLVSDGPDQRICFSLTQSGESLQTANLTFKVQAVGPNGLLPSQW